MSNLLFSKTSIKDLGKLSSQDRKRVLFKIDQLMWPIPTHLDVTALKGRQHYYRLRVGKIRVLFEVIYDSKLIWIRRVAKRGAIYRLM